MNEETKIWIEKAALIILLIIMFSLVILFATHKHYISDQGLVISFFGFLTTFVVIGNYAQSDRIRQQTEKELDKVTNKKDTDSIAYQIEQIKQDLKEGNIPKIKQIDEELEHKVSTIVAQKLILIDQQYTTLIKSMFGYLIPKDHVDLIETTINHNKSFECRVTSSTRVKKSVTARREGPIIVFRDKKGKIIEPVDTVNGVPYNEISICNIINLHDMVNKPIIDQNTTEFLKSGKTYEDITKLAEELKPYIDMMKEQKQQSMQEKEKE